MTTQLKSEYAMNLVRWFRNLAHSTQVQVKLYGDSPYLTANQRQILAEFHRFWCVEYSSMQGGPVCVLRCAHCDRSWGYHIIFGPGPRKCLYGARNFHWLGYDT